MRLFTKVRKIAALFKYNAENKRNLLEQIKISNLAEPHSLSLGKLYIFIFYFLFFIFYFLFFIFYFLFFIFYF